MPKLRLNGTELLQMESGVMSQYDTKYFEHLRCARGSPTRDPFFDAKSLQGATELCRREQLSWPKNLFGEPVSFAELLAEEAQLPGPGGEKLGDACPCGCRREHKLKVSQTLRSFYGRGFDVMYFWSESCQWKWNRERIRGQASVV